MKSFSPFLIVALPVLVSMGLRAQSVAISPSYASVVPGGTVQYVATVSGLARKTVTWSLRGKNIQNGTINPAGLYTAPKIVPKDGITITALAADKKTSATVYVNIALLGPAIKSVSPDPIPFGQYTATLTGSGFQPGSKVTLGGVPQITTYVNSTTLRSAGYQAAGSFEFKVQNSNTLPGPAFAVNFDAAAQPAHTADAVANRAAGSAPASAPVAVVTAPPPSGPLQIKLQSADLAAIPGSVRMVYATVEGTANLSVKWTATGGCTLASAVTTAAPQTVIAPAAGGTCKYQTALPTNEKPSFESPVSCKITATSVADATKTASIVIPVCAPPVTISAFPFTTVLYKNQFAVIQSDVRGSIDTAVTWAITTNPGGAGSLTGGASNRHAVFSAKAPGTYVLTATSVADGKKSASSKIYVTDHDLPAPNNDHTESVDCTAIGKGKVFEVGPTQSIKDLNAIAWNSLRPGDTVRIHNDDTTGASPTVYHQRTAISASGSATEPIRICGVPDAHGVKPILDGTDAATRPDEDWAGGRTLDGLGVLVLYDSAHKFDVLPDGNQNIIIEGLHIRNVNGDFKYSKLDGSLAPYPKGTACIRVQTGKGVLIRGNDLDNCEQGVFTNAQTPEGSLVYDLTVEGNYMHGWGSPKGDRQHGVYLQAIGLVMQFNYMDKATPETNGNAIKTRSVMNFVRWNFISQTPNTSRAFDVVEPQAFVCSVIPYQFAYAYHGQQGGKTDCNAPHKGPDGDTTPADQIAATFEAYHSDYIYGNIMDDEGSGAAFVHYGYDQQTERGPTFDRRGGTLFYWNNTHLTRKTSGQKLIFDAMAPDQGHSYEFARIYSVDNVFATSGSAPLLWTKGFLTQVTVDSDWIEPGYSLPSRNAADNYQGGTTPKEMSSCDPYGNCSMSNGHMLWARDGKLGTASASLYVGPTPFDVKTFTPSSKLHGLAGHLPKEIRDQPSNMEYFPATNVIKPREDQTYLGALD